MHDCQEYQGQLLDHLYALLNEAESQALLNHVRDCSACQTALDRAQRQQRLLAAAAKETFPRVRFEVPPLPTTVPMAPRPAVSVVLKWRRWAVAAAVLLLAGPAAWFGQDYVQLQNVVAQNTQALLQAQSDLQTTEGAWNSCRWNGTGSFRRWPGPHGNGNSR